MPDPNELRDAIQRVYGELVDDPKRGYHFHTGPEYAAERLGYSPAALAELPGSVTAPFAGVGNPLALGTPRQGETVVDIGAGSGMDAFLAARAVGPTGRVIAIDMTPAMLARGRENVALTGLSCVEYRDCRSRTESPTSSSPTASSTSLRTRPPSSAKRSGS
jgi:SAM-dependent methyltransferase